jgi:hypothetical protein
LRSVNHLVPGSGNLVADGIGIFPAFFRACLLPFLEQGGKLGWNFLFLRLPVG